MLSLGLSVTSVAVLQNGNFVISLGLGHWWQPSDIDTLFQDTAGTTPVTADGQTVARVNDKIGSSNALQASASLRPVYKDLTGAFSPSLLSPALAAWHDATDLTTLWQDTGATTPITADGQTVARVDDKSGNSRNSTQATSSLRPAYKDI